MNMTRGFDGVVGNPPWVSFVGRAAQPIEPRMRRYYEYFYEAFKKYRNLQGLFIERSVKVLRPGGRLGLVLPSSMADLANYGPTRAVLDRFAECDDGLPDLGEDAFRGVFQPSMVLRATRRHVPKQTGDDGPWPLHRSHIDSEAMQILDKLSGVPLPPDLFGERGFRSQGDDERYFHSTSDATHWFPIRAGGDIRAFRRGSPSIFVDPSGFGNRLRSKEYWEAVRLLIRQTACIFIAVLSDGMAFRNSILAGFESEEYPAEFLVAYLNSTPIRWQHYYRHRDARLGMPQVKIGHLRAIPSPPPGLVPTLTDMGRWLSRRNDGIREDEQRMLDEAVARAFGLTDTEIDRLYRDASRWGVS